MLVDKRHYRGWCVVVAVMATCTAGIHTGWGQTCENPWGGMFPGDGGPLGLVNNIAIFDNKLYLGGNFDVCMGRTVHAVAKWNGRRWTSSAGGVADADCNWEPVYALAILDDPNTLYAGARDGVHRMPDDPNMPGDPNDPNTFWPLVGATDGPVRALAVYQGALYAGGDFTTIDNDPNDETPPVPAAHIARWNGSTWEQVGEGIDPNDAGASVLALAVFDDGAGEALFAGGTFLFAGGNAANRIAKWNGTTWSALGDGLSEPTNAKVSALTVFDDGAGPALFAGGSFRQAGGNPANRIAKWDGASWSPLGLKQAYFDRF